MERRPIGANDEAADSATPIGPPPGAERDLIGVVVDRKYAVRAVLGSGGMGTVYEAENLTLGKLVAIKVLSHRAETNPIALARFYQEARTAGSLGHPNLCEVYDLGELADGRPFLVMERLEGETLRAALRRGPMSEPAVMDLGAQLLSGLAAAHHRGIVHRDIKPDNIFMCGHDGDERVAKILDFGVAKAVLTRRDSVVDTGELGITEAGMVMGTPFYMAPEQATGGAVDGKTDVFACGLVLYEALTGRKPFEAATHAGAVAQMLSDRPIDLAAALPGVNAKLAELLSAMLLTSQDDRPSAKQARAELLSILAGPHTAMSVVVESVGPPPSVRLDERFRQVAAAFGSFTAEFGLCLSDGVVTTEEALRMRNLLADLEKWCRHMRVELSHSAAGPSVPMRPGGEPQADVTDPMPAVRVPPRWRSE